MPKTWTQEPERKMLRIALDPTLVQRAKKQFGGEKPQFRQMLDAAIAKYLDIVDGHLGAAGFRKHPGNRGKPKDLADQLG